MKLGFNEWKFLRLIQENIVAGIDRDNTSLLRLIAFENNNFTRILEKKFEGEDINHVYGFTTNQIIAVTRKKLNSEKKPFQYLVHNLNFNT